MAESTEAKFIRTHWDELLEKYENEWIAVLGEEVIAHDEDPKKVAEEADKVCGGDKKPSYGLVSDGGPDILL